MTSDSELCLKFALVIFANFVQITFGLAQPEQLGSLLSEIRKKRKKTESSGI